MTWHNILEEAALVAARRRGTLLGEVSNERDRQDAKWGQQDHPDGTGRPGSSHLADYYRAVCQAHTPETDNWQDILAEEVFEAFAETDTGKLKQELIQIAAVAVSWLESMDRR